MVRVRYPRLFKTLSKMFGARKALHELRRLHEVKDACNLGNKDSLASAFIFAETPQGHNFWARHYFKGGIKRPNQ